MRRNISTNQLLLVARTWSNRGIHTDFQHFFNFFPGSINITNSKFFSWDNKFYRFLRNQARHDGYSSLSVRLELEVLKQALIHRPKIIHYWFADHDYHFASYIAKLVGAKIVGNFFFSIEEFERRMPCKNHLKKLDLITASGKEQMEYLSQFVSKDKLAYLPLGIDTDYFTPNKQRLNETKSQKTLLHVGTNRRDFHTLKMVFLKLKQLLPDIQLEMVGGARAKDIFAGLENVTFHTFLSDEELVKVYQSATILILPLLEGGSSQALNEAMASGLPVVTNDLPNLRDYVTEEAVFLSPVGNVEMMVRDCYKLLTDQNKLNNASQSARDHSLQYNFKNIRQIILNLYSNKLGYKIDKDFN